MAPRVEPILLWGFCFNTQQQQRFNQSWACAFHTSWYTDENHSMWDSVDDPSKRREIRYGNNIFVLFRVLLKCRDFYNHGSLWQAIARGFNTSPSVVRETVEILTEARRAQRDKPSKDVSDTAHAADEWIDFLDSRDSNNRPPPDSDVYKVVDAFFKAQEKKHLNAARVPVNGRQSFQLNLGRAPPRGPAAEELNTSHRAPTSPALKLESPREPAVDRHQLPAFLRKRSASPPGIDRSPKSRRFNHDIRPQPRVEQARHGALDELPTIQPTRSPKQANHSIPASVAASARPAQPMPQPSAPSRIEETPNASAQPARPTQPASQSNGPARREEASNAPAKTAVDDSTALRVRIASLETQLVETKSKLGAAPVAPPTPTTTHSSQLREDIGGLKTGMATATNAISTMMESMHDIADSLNSLQDEVSALSTQQKELTTTLSQSTTKPAHKSTDADAWLQPLQSLTETVDTLLTEVVSLKKNQPSVYPTPTPPPVLNEASQKQILETLLAAQNQHINKLFHNLQASLQRTNPSSLSSQTPQPQPQAQVQAQPQTLRQAMAAAERDLKHHLSTMQTFYHRGGASREVTERTADFLAMLSEGVRAAQAGQNGV